MEQNSTQDDQLTVPSTGAVLPPSVPKPGYMSTEFWITLGFQGVGVMVLLGYLQVDQVDEVHQTITKAVEAIGVLVSMAAVAIRYTTARENTKFFMFNGGKS